MEEKTYSCVEWLDCYKNEIEKIKKSSPFLSVLCIVSCIEFLGKLLNTDPLDCGDHSGAKFEKALSTFESLKKYAGKNLYGLIRCGLAHRISTKDSIILTLCEESKLENAPIVLNTNSFFEDFAHAVKEAQSKKDWNNSNALNPYVTIKNNLYTGATCYDNSIFLNSR